MKWEVELDIITETLVRKVGVSPLTARPMSRAEGKNQKGFPTKYVCLGWLVHVVLLAWAICVEWEESIVSTRQV